MGRYDTLNTASKDLVNCLLPAIAANFGVSDVVNVLPEDIRPRAWDCQQRQHIFEESEDDPRNWGVQFLKDLVSISRATQGNLEKFQADLRKKVEEHWEEHEWARLADVKELKDEYENPDKKNQPPPIKQEEAESESSYHEELVETENWRKTKRHANEQFEARKVKDTSGKKEPKRLRRSSSEGWARPVKKTKQPTPAPESAVQGGLNDDDLESMTVEELEAQYELSQAELKAAQLKVKLAEAKRKAASKHKGKAARNVQADRTRTPARKYAPRGRTPEHAAPVAPMYASGPRRPSGYSRGNGAAYGTPSEHEYADAQSHAHFTAINKSRDSARPSSAMSRRGNYSHEDGGHEFDEEYDDEPY